MVCVFLGFLAEGEPLALPSANKHEARSTPSFLRQKCASKWHYKASQKADPLPENPDATSSSGLFWSAAAKPVRVNCRPPETIAAAVTF